MKIECQEIGQSAQNKHKTCQLDCGKDPPLQVNANQDFQWPQLVPMDRQRACQGDCMGPIHLVVISQQLP